MSTVKDAVGNVVHEDDYVAFSGGRGRVTRISPIMDRGPYQGGTRVTVVHEVDFALPPGMKALPEIQLVVTSEEERKKDARRKEGKVEEGSSLLVKP